ncbi:N-acetyltransferase [Pedobacter sp. ASV1-7]|uniref:N-acetyltransferase n=1 Tax=Pedobacter sp. ASV1-7 TaxID=3145237 RepID=UPI0032E91087
MIRVFEETDLDKIVQIWLDASIIAHDFIPSTYWKEKAEDMKNLYLPASKTFVYQNDTVILGFISMVDNYIAAIFVNPESQGQGIGKQLIEYIKRQHSLITLGVYSKNIRSIDFYKRQGFVITDEKIEENTGEFETLMELQ